MKRRAKRVSIFMIFLLVMQSFVTGFAPIQTAYAEGNKNDTFFDFESISENSFTEEENGRFLHIDWSLAGYDLEDVSQTVDFDSSVALAEQEGTISLEGEAVEIASFKTTEDVIQVTFNEAALEYPEAEGRVKLQVPVEEEVVEEEITEESVEGSTEETGEEGTEEAVEEEAAEEGTEEAIEEEAVEEGTEEAIEEEAVEEGTEGAVEEEAAEEENTAASAAFNVGPQAELGNIFTFESLKIDGQAIEDGDIISITEGTIADLRFSWHTQGRNAKAGDTAEIGLSAAFMTVTTPVQDLIVEGTKVGTYHVEDGVLKFVFDEGIETSDVQNGFVNLGLEFNLDKFRENIEQEIPFNDGHENNITVIARPHIEHNGIEKEGHPDTDHDAREITWTIDVINTNDEEITGATLADNIPDGLGEARDFVIHKLNIGFDGDISEGDDVTSTFNPSEFPIGLGEIAPFNGYRVQYTTTIENYAAESFTNDATFKYGEKSLPADATVGGLTRSNPIEKDGWQDGDSDVIQWQIDVNKNGSLISNAIIEDSLPAGLTVDPDSIQVVRITQSGGNWVEGDAHGDSFTGFPINLGALGQDDAYRIKFKTDINWADVNNSTYQKDNGFLNVATLKDGENELNSDDATVNIVRDPVLRKEGVSNVDYENKTISWTIHVNEAGHPIGNVVLTDLIPEGLAISESDIVITDEEGNSYTPVNISLNPDADGGTAVVINLGDVGTHKLKVEYTTAITDFTKNNFNNGVGMIGDGVGEAGENSNAEIKPAANTYGKSFRGIDYNAKTINWQLNVNPRREAIDTLVIEDTFPNKGMILLPGSVEVKHAGNSLVKGTDYILAPRTEDGETGYHKGFTITLLDNALPLNGGQLSVDYQTSYNPQEVVDGNTLDPHISRVGGENQDGARLYVNRAHFEGETVNGNPIDETRNAETRVREDSWNSGKKEGQLVHFDDEGNAVNGWASGSERKIAWQLYTNYQEQNLGTGISITDELDYAGNIDEGSIKVSVYDVAANGETTITGSVLDPDSYSITVQGGKFTLTFAEGFELTERYAIEFTTSVPDISKSIYTNNATVTAGGVEYPYSATLNYSEYDDFLAKRAINSDGNRVFTGDEVEWEATVNKSLSIIKNAVITDTLSPGHVYLSDSLEVYKTQDLDNALIEGTDYTLDVSTTDDGENVLTINMTEDLHDSLVLKYTTVVTATDGEIGNKISLDGTAMDQQVVNSDKLNARQFSDAGGEWAPNRGALSVTKVDSETEETITNEATFTLWYDLNGERVQYTQEEAFTTVDGVLEIGNLPLRTYYLVEKEAPTGYVISEEEIEIVVNKAFGNNEENIVSTTFENTKEKIDVTGTKEWQGGENQRPESIDLQLFRNGEALGEPITLEAGKTEYTWSDLDKTDIDGNAYEYTVDEVNVPDNYEKSISEDGLTITNEFVSPSIDIPVEKVWDDANNQDGNRPESIEVTLLANGEKTDVENVILSNENGWQGSFTNLPELDNSGDKITYTVAEVNVPEQYESNIAGEAADGFVITNSYTPGIVEIPVEKVWEDTNNQDGARPDGIIVRLLADGEATVRFIILNEANNWEGSFTDLDEYQDGERINYTVVESNVPAKYESAISGDSEDGYTITNSYTPELTDIPVEKVWDDADNQDGARPDSITIHLYDDRSQVVDTQKITPDEDGNWSHVFENLPKYRDGHEIVYRVAEDTVEDYSTAISDNGTGTITVTNEHTPEQTSVTVNKLWNDANNQDGQRPDNIRIQLLADGEALGSEVLVTAEDNWSYTWSGLDANREGGEAITYTVEEVDVPAGYESEINDENHGAITITNSREPELINIPVSKVWDDADNQDGVRPNSVTVNVINDLSEIVDTIELNEDNDWTHTFKNLPKNRNGEEISYRVTENKVENYSTELGTSVDGNVTITNAYTPEQTSVTVLKGWNDNDNQDGIRPEQIEVQLYAGENEVGDKVILSAENNWMHTWSELDAYQNGGEEIDYTVKEVSVPKGYEVSINDADHGNIMLTNHHESELIDLEGTKTWEDADDQDGKRPESITVRLSANGNEVNSVEVSEESDWSYAFTNLPKFENGEEINYTVQEDNVEDYSAEINGMDITNSYEPEQTSINVVKSWNDANNKAGARPESITVKLLANGEETGKEAILSNDTNWQTDFRGLDVYANGSLIEYTVEEEDVPNYESNVTVNEENTYNFTVTNNYNPAKVSVGDYVWFDENKDGLQDETDIPLEGVVLTIEDEEGNPVTDVYGNPVGPVTTDENGYYIFENLPIDKTYIVRIDREASKEALKGYVPTLEEAGDDNSIDSSLWFAVSRHLTEDGDHDPTLDFGFVKADPEEPGKEPEEPGKEPEEPGKEPGEDPGKEPGEDPGKEPGEDPGKDLGEDPGKDPGEDPGKDPGEDPGKDPGEDPGKGSAEASGKTDSGVSEGTDKGDGETLPGTATSMFNLLLISLGLLGAGAILVIVNRFRNRSSDR
ncbi:Cna B-type domain-containing protein [Oceanobacillus neutriphilus]|uniref:Cna B-type domain-containing protein n=1 Tax=Oceanobacillus neutriphilus TaxID=531815 RepID=A0ABQ2P387_9BACI|nr:Cna B-type domain-containing protein [Oceanobacillus neutriphilus]GGP17037.1 hypothetical protein GCM10011346_51340 [Oceanobacillus neutriphilus]